jgi:hypothetical protein
MKWIAFAKDSCAIGMLSHSGNNCSAYTHTQIVQSVREGYKLDYEGFHAREMAMMMIMESLDWVKFVKMNLFLNSVNCS